MKRLTLTDFKRDIKFYWQAMKTRDIYFHLNLKIQAQKNTFVQRSTLLQEVLLCWTTKHKKRGYEALDEVLEVLLYFQ